MKRCPKSSMISVSGFHWLISPMFTMLSELGERYWTTMGYHYRIGLHCCQVYLPKVSYLFKRIRTHITQWFIFFVIQEIKRNVIKQVQENCKYLKLNFFIEFYNGKPRYRVWSRFGVSIEIYFYLPILYI